MSTCRRCGTSYDDLRGACPDCGCDACEHCVCIDCYAHTDEQCRCAPDEIGVARTVVGVPMAMLWERRGRVVRYVLRDLGS